MFKVSYNNESEKVVKVILVPVCTCAPLLLVQCAYVRHQAQDTDSREEQSKLWPDQSMSHMDQREGK